MCRKFVIASSLETIENRFCVRFDQNLGVISKSYYVSCGDSTYDIISQNRHSLEDIHFGMTPYYGIKSVNLIKARSD
jgi:hypothetical protein